MISWIPQRWTSPNNPTARELLLAPLTTTLGIGEEASGGLFSTISCFFYHFKWIYFFLVSFCLILISSIFSFQAGKGGEYLCQWRHICRRGTLWNWDANYWGGCKKSSIKCFQRWRANEQRTKAEKNIFSLLSGWTTRGTGKGNWPGLLEGSCENIGLFLNWWVPAIFNYFWL